MADIEQLLYPSLMMSLKEDIPPVRCLIWKGNSQYDTLILDNVYPFDTIEDIKRQIYVKMDSNSIFLPKFLFMGIVIGEDSYSESMPNEESKYIPADFLWYPKGTNDPKKTYILRPPNINLNIGDSRFVTSTGDFSNPNFESRARSTIEDVFLKPRNGLIPTIHVYPLYYLLKEFKGQIPISEEDWNNKFAPYYRYVDKNGPYVATEEDIEESKMINIYVNKRQSTVDVLNSLLEQGVDVPSIKTSGIRYLRLIWNKPVSGFEGCGSTFYRILVTEKKPYMRLIPAEGSAISKVHVSGVLPIPTLEDPKILESWAKEITPTPGSDVCYIKYVHKQSVGIIPPLYGTIILFNDGTMELAILPPKQIRKLDPVTDFRNFTENLNELMKGLPQSPESFRLKDMSVIFSFKYDIRSKKFTKSRLMKRLALFQNFFQEISPLPGETTLISLRYKAISQYVTEDKTFTFLTQYATKKMMEGEEATDEMIDALQNEFQISKKRAKEIVFEWFQNKGTFTLTVPDDGEFIESFNPGIDMHIYSQHPSYFIHINRIDSIQNYQRIYSLLSLLFLEDDGYYEEYSNVDKTLNTVSEKLEKESISREQKSQNDTIQLGVTNERQTEDNQEIEDEITNENTASAIPDYLLDLMMNQANITNKEETNIKNIPNPINHISEPVGESKEIELQQKNIQQKNIQPKKQITAPAINTNDKEEYKLINPRSWFITKLQEIDPALFNYTPEDKDADGYSRLCAGNDDRQPAVLTKEQYERMREVYENDNIFFMVYPIEGSEDPTQPVGTEEVYTLMKYGSDYDNINYYFCPLYFCLSDEIMIRPKDFESTMDRDGNPKPPNTCPFCRGKLIVDRKKALPGYTVIKRKNKPKSDNFHSYIYFLKKTTHPKQLALPCCYVLDTTVRSSDPRFSHLKSAANTNDIIDNNYSKADSKKEESIVSYDIIDGSIEYGVLFESLYKRYILESNKSPDPGVFAASTPEFDKFFVQDSGEKIVTRVAIHLKLRPNAEGFLRIGTENTVNESLLGVIAPLLYKNSINEVKERILEVVTPRIFLASHFGNLVLEFYDPSDSSVKQLTQHALKGWASKELQVDINETNMYSLLRLYNAYERFIRFIKDPSQRKDLRHIQPLLAEPGLFTSRGLQLLIMEYDEQNNNVNIKCPSFGISMDRHKRSDVAFISKHTKNIGSSDVKYSKYELYVYTKNRPAKGGQGEFHEAIIRWDYSSRSYWPDIVNTRVNEYLSQCQSRYRSIYTSQQGVDPMAMIPLSKAIQTAQYFPVGVIRDSYNHIVALTFRTKPGRGQLLVALPVVDDGYLPIQLTTHFDWDDYVPASIEDTIEYYRNNLEGLFSLYPGYKIAYIVRGKQGYINSNKYLGLQLENGIYIPVGTNKTNNFIEKYNLKVVEVEELEWDINRQISGIKNKSQSESRSCGKDEELMKKSTYTEFEELYQNFRMMVSNWLTSSNSGPELRKNIENIIFNKDLPDFEKRKRLYIYLSSYLLSWFYTDKEKWEQQTTLLRKDCRLIDSEDKCTGTCHWKKEESDNTGKCLLHVSEKISLNDQKEVYTPELFTKRIVDELVRFPYKRKQLFKKGEITKVSTIVEPIHIGDQYIIPEGSPSWANLLRLEWTKQTPEKPKYYEEMSRIIEGDNTQNNIKNNTNIVNKEIPSQLYNIFGNKYKLWIPSYDEETIKKPLLPFSSILEINLSEWNIDPSEKNISDEKMIEYVKKVNKPLGIINIIGNDINIRFVRPARGMFESTLILVFIEDNIGALVEYEGVPTVNVETMPEILKQKWDSSTRVMIRKVKKETDEEKQVPAFGAVPIRLKKRVVKKVEEAS